MLQLSLTQNYFCLKDILKSSEINPSRLIYFSESANFIQNQGKDYDHSYIKLYLDDKGEIENIGSTLLVKRKED